MSREIDRREFAVNRVDPARVQALRALAGSVSERMRGSHRVVIEKFDATTGNPAVVSSQAAPAESGNYVMRALEHAQAISPALGLVSQAPEFSADAHVQTTSSGAHAVNLQQRYKGIPVFQAAIAVRFVPNGAIDDTVGSTISVSGDIAVHAALSVQDAVRIAAHHVAEPAPDEQNAVDPFGERFNPPRVDLTGFEPRVRAAFGNTAERSTVLDAGPFGADILASLVWFPDKDTLVLGWSSILTMPRHEGQYHTIVSAETGQILYCHQMVQFATAVGNVYRVDGGSPRQMTNFPRPVNEFGLPMPSQAQDNWRWCHKCQGLFFAGNSGSHCAAGGAHENAGSADYFLVPESPLYPGQAGWRWCHKCQGLFFGGNPGSHCPAGGAHENAGSANYSLLSQNALAPGQHDWRWCHKCQGLFFGGNAGSHCPAGGAHENAGSFDYSLLSAASGLPAAFPGPWVTASATIGNSTRAHLDVAGPSFTGALQGGVLTFNPANATGDDQKVLNIFYYCCYMHDFSYLLGFREGSGNFQANNLGNGGLAGDAVDARSFPGAVFGTANMSRSVDGTSPIMNMGMVTSTNRHTAFDSTVVFHEFTHGISNRLVGGGLNMNNLDSPQSGGMGEGWSDYIACTINNVTVVGNWILNNTAGIRNFPYTSSYPHHFGDVGKTVGGINYSEVHNLGEIWCATLLEMNRRTDRHLAVQLVIDALKLTPANPGFLDARDAILTALAHMLAAGRINGNQRDGVWQGIWGAFAKFGMGPQAASNGAQLSGIVADFTVGQDNWRWCRKCQGLFFGGNPGSRCPAGGAHENVGSSNYDIVMNWPAAPGQNNWRWCHKCQGMFFAGNPGSHCPASGAHENAGSGDYKLIFNALGSPSQTNWRWCHKCQGLFFGGNPGSHCPTGGTHDSTGSGNYGLMQR